MKCLFQIIMITMSVEIADLSYSQFFEDEFTNDCVMSFSSLLKNSLAIQTGRPLSNTNVTYFDIANEEAYKLIALIGLCCITIVIIVSKYKKNIGKDKLTYESEINKAKLRLVALREKQELLAQEFELNSNKLKEIADQLESKKQVLANIKQLVELTSSEQLINSETKSKFSRIGRNIQYSFHADQEWYHFKSYFENANERFLSNLKEKFPTLSPNDYKLCVLYKTDSDHERVASIMEISAESARVMKHRLKKKLELPLNECLSAFLRNLDNQVDSRNPQEVCNQNEKLLAIH